MSSTRKSSILDVSWTEQMGLLGVRVQGRSLPAVVTCPLCQGDHLAVHQGPAGQGGPHAHCVGCGFAGTLLELSARAWQISPAEAAAKSTDLGVPLLPFDHTDEDIAAAARSLAPLERMRSLWADARANVQAGRITGVAKVLAQAHAQPTAAAGRRYFSLAGALYGVVPFQRVEAAFTPESLRSRSRGAAFNPSDGRLFAGRGWRDVVVLPRYDRPGRLCAFEFVGRKGSPADRVVATTSPGAGELGLFGLDAALADTPFGRTVLAVDDALLALRLQARHAAGSSVALPIVSWADHGHRRTAAAWECLAGRKVVFWTREPTARMVRQTLQSTQAGADVYVTDAGPRRPDDPAAFDHFIRLPGSAGAFHKKLDRQALPLYNFLSRWVEQAPGGKLESFLRGLLRNGLDPLGLARHMTAKARDRVEDMRPDEIRGQPRTVAIGKYTVAETRGGWYAYGGRTPREPRLLSSVVVRLVGQRDSVYDAVLVAGDQEVHVELPARCRPHRFARLIHALAAQHGLDASFGRVPTLDLLEVALAFSGTPPDLSVQQPSS